MADCVQQVTNRCIASDPCIGRTDGMYSLGCSTRFVGCVGEQAMFLRCPENLVYDVDKNQCLARVLVLSHYFSLHWRCFLIWSGIIPTECSGYKNSGNPDLSPHTNFEIR